MDFALSYYPIYDPIGEFWPMAAISVVALDRDECERRLRAFVAECRGKIDHIIPYSSGPEFHIALPDDKVQLLLARPSTSGGFRWRGP